MLSHDWHLKRVKVAASLPPSAAPFKFSRNNFRHNYQRQRLKMGLSFLGRLVALVVLGYGLWLLTFSDWLLVKTIQVRGAKYYVSASRVEKALANFKGRHLLTLSAGGVTRQLQALLPELGGNRVKKLFPATLVIEVKSERPLAVLRQEYFEPRYVISETGKVIAAVFGEQAETAGLLNIFMPAEFVRVEEQEVEQSSFEVAGSEEDRTQGIEGIEIGTAFVSQSVVAPTAVPAPILPVKTKQVPLELPLGGEVVKPAIVSQIQRLLTEFDYRVGVGVQEVWHFPLEDELHLVTAPGWRVKFSLQRDLSNQLADLGAALQQLNFVKKDFRYLDLRIANKIFVCRDQVCA